MKKIFKRILLVILALIILGLFVGPFRYLRKALIYQKAGIEDYKIFENRIVEAGDHQPWGMASDSLKKDIPVQYISEMEKYKTVAFLVIQDTAILYEKYWEGYNENSLSNSFSMAKSIVSLLIGIAIDEGKINSIEQKVGDFIPEYNKGENSILTIKHVLTMSSGLNWDERYASPFSVTTKAYYGDNLKKLVTNLKIIEEPGINFKYLSGNTQLLSFIVECATGKKVSEYASEELWKPLGAKNDAIWCLDKEEGDEKAYCCFNSNARDFARFGQLVLNNGKWGNRQLISETYLKESTQPASYLNDRNGKPVDFYGYQWWIVTHKGFNIIYARGLGGQYICSVPEKNAVIVRLGHSRSKVKIGEHPEDIFTYLDAALEILH